MTDSIVDNFSGVLLVDKPSGMTSHTVIAKLRRFFGIKKIGHAGTLDPLATGLMIVLIGRKATRIAQNVIGLDKDYSGEMRLGQVTDSYDSDGNVVSEKNVPNLDDDQFSKFANEFVGEQMQLPPMFSAKKLNGKCLYKFARKGIEVERKSSRVNIFEFNVNKVSDYTAKFYVSCSKGTYVRSLIHDFGQKIGCGSHVTSLRRLTIGKFSVKNALPLADLLNLIPADVMDGMMCVEEFLNQLHE